MTASPYAASAVEYRDNGLSVIPCIPGDKFPGTWRSDMGWSPRGGWQTFCERMPNAFEVRGWDEWPDAGICLALGAASGTNGLHLVALDIDTDVPAEVAAIKSVLPGSPCVKRGAKGETQFYLASPAVKSRPFNDRDKRRLLDLLCAGRQTVVPPTIHPGTGAPYVWLSPDTLGSIDLADLPVLPDDIGDRLAEALKPFGHEPLVAREPVQGVELGIDNPWRSLNDAALDNLDAWVPGLQLVNCRHVGDKYKATAHWRPSSTGRHISQRNANLAISSEGIKDCGEGKGYTPLDLVMAAFSADLDTAFGWLQKRVAPMETVTLSPSIPAPAAPPLAASAPAGADSLHQLASGPVIPAGLCTPPGLIGDVARFIIETDDGATPQLALGAAIAFLGAMAGKRFAHPYKGGRANFYCVGVAKTGVGKNHALVAITELAETAGLTVFLGPSRFKSDSSIRNFLQKKHVGACSLMDELGGWLKQILNPRAGNWESGAATLLMDLFSKANTTYHGAEGASEAASPIRFPHLCIYGASTPHDLWGSLDSGSGANGFLGRWLVFDAGERRNRTGISSMDISSPPASLCAALQAFADSAGGQPRGNLGHIGGAAPRTPCVATWGEGASECLMALKAREARQVAAAEAAGRRSEENIIVRFVEHVAKLSLLYAVTNDPQSPTITVEGIEWAQQVVASSCTALIAALEGNIADNERQREYLYVKGLIYSSASTGMKKSELTRRINGKVDKVRLAHIIEQLKEADEIEELIKENPGAGRKAAMYVPLRGPTASQSLH